MTPAAGPSRRGRFRGRVQGVRTPSPLDDLRFSNTTGILQKKKKRTMWFIGVEVEQETSAPPPKKNPGSAPELFEGRLALTLGKILTPVSFSFDQKHFSG